MVNVSVIIPVYNAEKYLKDCIESLLRQTLPELEFIFVNDGSKDTSAQIIASYQATDSRITLINQPNQGVSVARNNGIAAAQGDYIGFVDADDTIDPDFFEMHTKASHDSSLDIVFSLFIREQDGYKIKSELPFPKNIELDDAYIHSTIIPYMISQDALNTCCTKIYKRSLLLNNSVRFPEKVALGEDGFFNFQAFTYAKSVVLLNYAGYFYREVQGSATRDLLRKDYFNRALQVYHFDIKEKVPIQLSDFDIKQLKTLRLAEKVLEYTFIYLKPNNGLSFFKKYSYVRKMIHHPIVKEAYNNQWVSIQKKRSRFQKITLLCIKYQFLWILIVLSGYSYYRNK